jgi:hypothetical protein
VLVIRRSDVTRFGVPEHPGDGSLLPMLIQSGNLRLEIGSSDECRFHKGGRKWEKKLGYSWESFVWLS